MPDESIQLSADDMDILDEVWAEMARRRKAKKQSREKRRKSKSSVETLEESQEDDAKAIARTCVDLLNVLLRSGQNVDDHVDDFNDELASHEWYIDRHSSGILVPVHYDDCQLTEAREEGETWQGKSGRWFTVKKGRTVPTRAPGALARSGVKQRIAGKVQGGALDRQVLAQKLAKHAREANASQQGSASRMARMLSRHHGEEGALHRLHELADSLEASLGHVQGDDWKSERLRKLIAGKLSILHAAMHEVGKPARGPREKKGTRAVPEYGRVYNANLDQLHVDPSRFQFKLNVDASGVTQELKQVKKFNPDFAGVLSVWLDPDDGNTYVINGHHRHELARRLGHDNLAIRYIQAGSAKEARAIGALINIAEGRGTAIDAAKFMRNSGVGIDELESRGVSLRGKLATDAAILTRLSDRQFDRLARGLLDESKALAVARHLSDGGLQDQLFSLLDRREEDGKDLSLKVIEEMAREMAETPKTTRTERSLFGDIESEESLFVPRAEIKSHVRSELSREVSDYLAVASKRRAERVSGAGNVLDTEKNREIASEAERIKNTFDQLVNSRGHISDAINRAAEDYVKGKTRKEKEDAKKRATEAVRSAIRDKLGGVGPDDRGGQEIAPDEQGAAETDNAGRGNHQSAGLNDEPGFTGIDAQGRQWVNGELVAKAEQDSSSASFHPGDKVVIPARGNRMEIRAKFFHVDDPEMIGVGWGDQSEPQVKMPLESAKHFVNDLSGVVDVTPDSGNQFVDAVARGQGDFLGKGDDGIVFGVGDKVVKVSTTVPFQPFNPGHKSPGDAARRLIDQAKVNNLFVSRGVPCVLKFDIVSHADKSFLIRDRLEIPETLNSRQLGMVRRAIDAIHELGFVVGDDIQVGLKNGDPILFDLGKAQKARADFDYQDDSDRFERFSEKMGGEPLPLKKYAEKSLVDATNMDGFMDQAELAKYREHHQKGLNASRSAEKSGNSAEKSGNSAVDAALARYESRESLPAAKGALFGGDDLRSREGFAKLPDGTEVVITEGPHRGKMGVIKIESSLNGDRRKVVEIDGNNVPVSHTAVEPVNPLLSWRTDAGAASQAKQGGLFANTAPAKREQSEEERELSEIGTQLNGLSRSGASSSTIRGVQVDRVGIGRYRVSVSGKEFTGDQGRVAEWIAKHGDRSAGNVPTPAQAWNDVRDVHKQLQSENRRIGGIVKVPDLVDAVLKKHPGLSPTSLHEMLKQWQKEDKLTLQLCNDPRLEPRADEGIRSPRGLLYYVQMR